MLFWQMLLGVRLIIKNITGDYSSTVKIHKLLGKYGTIFVLIHPFLESYSYAQNLVFTLPDFTTEFGRQITVGRAAFFMAATIWLTSAIIRKSMKYRPWIYLHYLSYPIMFFVFLHARELGTFLNTIPFIKLYFYLLMAGYLVVMAVKAYAVLNFDKKTFKLSKVVKSDGNIFAYTLQPINKRILFLPGQFAYIKTHFFGESHPFSVTEYNEKTGELVFGIKATGKFTNKITSLKRGHVFYLDGPHGKFTLEGQNNEPKILIAGGIGITPFIELVKRFGDKNTYLFYSNPFLKNAIYRSEVKKILKNNYFDVITKENIKDEKVINGRLTYKAIEMAVGKNLLNKSRIFICGSPSFNEGIKKMLLDSGVNKNKIFIEDFGF